jgi:high-affinity nickel-transport protein
MLIVLGVMNVAGFLRSMPHSNSGHEGESATHSHPHSHGDYIHNHPHSHDPEAHPHPYDQTPLARLDRIFGRVGLYQYIRPFVVGVVHGLAGSAAVALLVLTTIRNVHWAIGYLLVFGVGTIAGMMLITMSIASAFTMVGKGRRKLSQRLALASGLLSLGFGLLVAYQICFLNGLFTTHAQWTPQ